MKYILISFYLLFSSPVFSQLLKGRFTGTDGSPVPAVSIYIRETKQGLIANNDGEFQVKLLPGDYHLEIRCLGYETEEKTVLLANRDLEIAIQLKEKDFHLKEIEVKWTEDPANEIIRQAIKKAPYYRSAVKESTYETYVKGSGKITHVSGLINSLSDGELENFEDKLLLQESVSEVKFFAPDRYEQKVIAFSSTIPFAQDPESALMAGAISLYNPLFGGVVSPLNPKAFDYYRFRYEGYEEENGQIINKIRVIPKLKDNKLMEGFIHIAEKEWNIRYAEIATSSVGMTRRSKLNYHPVIDSIYLVTACEIEAEFHLFGIKLNVAFLSTIQYTDIQLNDSLIAARQKEVLPEKGKKRKSLELKDDDYLKKTVDTLAQKRDSLYWSDVRAVVLNEEELKSYERKDTLLALVDSLERKEKKPGFTFSGLIFGGQAGNDSSRVRFSYSGLLGAVPEYNFVDGFWIGQSLKLDFKTGKKAGFRIYPSAHWTSARKKPVWETEINLDYAPKRLGVLQVSFGNKSEDFSGEAGMNRFLHSLFILNGSRNYIRYYEKKQIRLSNLIDIGNGLQWGLGVEMAERTALVNHTSWNLYGIKNRCLPNVPEYDGDLHPEQSLLSAFRISLKYTPEYYYRMEEGKKRYVRSRFPTFEVNYQQGLDVGEFLFKGTPSTFRRLELGVKQEIKMGIFDRLNYTLIAGKYLNDNEFNYIDYKHFNTGGPWLTFNDLRDSYTLLPYYTCSTPKGWLQAFVNYDTDYLVLKRLPFLQGKLFSESLQAKFLHTPDKEYYSEWGYSVHLPAGIGGAGIFVSFDSFRYNSFGLQLTLPLFGKIGKGNREISVSVDY
ncbi:MAG: DUF5686 and carboxypeptidase regulatory-like domain-containing protein [Candidatus Symbiothrix sp.]|jgi:hypothetical protein|nr:DUF5686 and carboxypeptidase regulatory-like domain-containing protein [Candidatus Symbiothrix sp.]